MKIILTALISAALIFTGCGQAPQTSESETNNARRDAESFWETFNCRTNSVSASITSCSSCLRDATQAYNVNWKYDKKLKRHRCCLVQAAEGQQFINRGCSR